MNRWLPLPVLLLIPALASAARRFTRPPNVILIVSDDQGTLDLNCYGSRDLHTPSLDRLARWGAVHAGVRGMSGLLPVAGMVPHRPLSAAGVVDGQRAVTAGGRGMPTEQVTLAEVLKSAGYRTGIFGKWHLGTTPDTEPNGQGFDEFFGFHAGCIDDYSHYFYWQGPPVHDLWRN